MPVLSSTLPTLMLPAKTVPASVHPTNSSEKGALMQTCSLRAVSRGQAPPADSDPLPAQVAPDQEGHPPFPNPSGPSLTRLGSRPLAPARTRVVPGGRWDLRLMGAPVLLARCRNCRSRGTRGACRVPLGGGTRVRRAADVLVASAGGARRTAGLTARPCGRG